MSFFVKEDMVDLVVGAEEKAFHVHARVLRAVPFFNKALNSGFAESLSKVIKMPVDESLIVEYLLCWLHDAEIPEKPSDVQIRASKDHNDDDPWQIWAKVKSWILADKIGITHLKGTLLKDLRQSLEVPGVTLTQNKDAAVEQRLTMDLIDYVYDKTTPKSDLRKLLAQSGCRKDQRAFR